MLKIKLDSWLEKKLNVRISIVNIFKKVRFGAFGSLFFKMVEFDSHLRDKNTVINIRVFFA